MRNPFTVTIGDKISHLYKSQGVFDGTFLWFISQDQVWSFISSEFWIYVKKEHLEHSQLATEVLLLFGTTYLCEKTFSTTGAIKSKYRNHHYAFTLHFVQIRPSCPIIWQRISFSAGLLL
jgi:hypothetical protein